MLAPNQRNWSSHGIDELLGRVTLPDPTYIHKNCLSVRPTWLPEQVPVAGPNRSIPSTHAIQDLYASILIPIIAEGELPTSGIAMTKVGVALQAVVLATATAVLFIVLSVSLTSIT